MSENHQIQKEASRRSNPDRTKFKKRLQPRNLLFDSSPGISNDSITSNHIPVLSDHNSSCNSFMASPSDPGFSLSASSGSSLHSELTQSSEVKPGIASKGDSTSFNSIEAEIVIDFLRKAMTQALNSRDVVDSQSRKLLEATMEIIIAMLETAPKETDRIGKVLQAKTRIVLVFILLSIFAMVVTWIFGSSSRSSFGKPPPT